MKKGGGLNQILNQAQKLQSKLTRLEDDMKGKVVEASAGDGRVTAVVNGNRELLEVLNGINRDLRAPLMEAFDPGRRGAADISFVAPHVDAGLAALGVFGRGAHSQDEEIDLASLPLIVQRTALLV